MPEIEGFTCWRSDGVQGGRRKPEPILPEDILYQIHALMPMKDAACASTVSRGFLRSWRCYPNLVFNSKMFGINEDTPNNINEITSDFIGRVDHIMTNHSGTGVKKFKLQTNPCDNLHLSYVDRWLQVATAPGIEEFELQMPWCNKIEYNFPCSLLSTERGSSLQSFVLDHCAFHPAAEVGCLSSLTSVHLSSVRITAEELCSFLSKSLALKQLDIYRCNDIVCLKIPYELSHLNFLAVQDCVMLEMIESDAPKLSQFNTTKSNMLYCARTKLPSIAPNVQTLFLTSLDEKVNTPMLAVKFLYLKHLEIVLVEPSLSPDYDFCSLASFLDGSPSLDTLILHVEVPTIREDSILEFSDYNSYHSRQILQHSNKNLRNVTITGFCSAKSMIEFTNDILAHAPVLECLVLDTSRGHERKIHKSTMCLHMFEEDLVEVQRARMAIERHVVGNVPSTVNLKVLEPCSKCLS
ncbi:hypothetical protein BDA96_04G071900 [Sorghum bicolor]|uniref:At1g61320/AtMIF1 LRR domain-containing protein n=1 Tax=Sorghum bicolor TaxID=4558 RepID=A0A921R4L0_SORBI|nr:hypothetical protein BDA96_04G071900 [Sorghum bicolor]